MKNTARRSFHCSIRAILLAWLAGCSAVTVWGQTSTVTVVSAASNTAPVATESIAAAYGMGLAEETAVSPINSPQTLLAGTTLTITDSAGMARLAPMFSVSPGQINILVPANTAVGTASVTVRRNETVIGTGSVEIAPVAPGLFVANANGLPRGYALRFRANGSQMREEINVPIDLSVSSDRVFLVLFGTGLRAGRSVMATIGGEPAIPGESVIEANAKK